MESDKVANGDGQEGFECSESDLNMFKHYQAEELNDRPTTSNCAKQKFRWAEYPPHKKISQIATKKGGILRRKNFRRLASKSKAIKKTHNESKSKKQKMNAIKKEEGWNVLAANITNNAELDRICASNFLRMDGTGKKGDRAFFCCRRYFTPSLRCPYRGLFLRKERVLYARKQHNHPLEPILTGRSKNRSSLFEDGAGEKKWKSELNGTEKDSPQAESEVESTVKTSQQWAKTDLVYNDFLGKSWTWVANINDSAELTEYCAQNGFYVNRDKRIKSQNCYVQCAYRQKIGCKYRCIFVAERRAIYKIGKHNHQPKGALQGNGMSRGKLQKKSLKRGDRFEEDTVKGIEENKSEGNGKTANFSALQKKNQIGDFELAPLANKFAVLAKKMSLCFSIEEKRFFLVQSESSKVLICSDKERFVQIHRFRAGTGFSESWEKKGAQQFLAKMAEECAEYFALTQ